MQCKLGLRRKVIMPIFLKHIVQIDLEYRPFVQLLFEGKGWSVELKKCKKIDALWQESVGFMVANCVFSCWAASPFCLTKFGTETSVADVEAEVAVIVVDTEIELEETAEAGAVVAITESEPEIAALGEEP